MTKQMPNKHEMFLNMLTIIKHSIYEATGEPEKENEHEVESLVDDMANAVLDSMDIEFLAWSPKRGKMLSVVELDDLEEFFS